VLQVHSGTVGAHFARTGNRGEVVDTRRGGGGGVIALPLARRGGGRGLEAHWKSLRWGKRAAVIPDTCGRRAGIVST
jgi:hypothetical protein